MADDRGSLLQRHLLLVQALCDPELSKGDCQVLAMIGTHAGKTGTSWPGVDRIAAKAGIHRSTVIRSVDNLEARGYVQVSRKRGLANRYQMALASSADATSTSSTHATSEAGAPVAPTHTTSSADATRPVAPTLRDPSRPRYPNSAFELSSSNSEKRTQPPAAPSFDEWIKQEPEHETAEEGEKRRQLQREMIRAEYLEIRESYPKHAALMLRTFPQHLADLMPDNGRLPPLEA
ncbi:helix-turn-helix domain-containing protein [Cognatiluteimonas telluris]|uniref:helix-turn-helix domain-containing protein n=1 Tax=Cognatiluteimonas telluris TaxID=1104775 RepID=UPI00140D8FF5|nr:helix-turn-helix domain-containing protein [Lysobacter telluris]